MLEDFLSASCLLFFLFLGMALFADFACFGCLLAAFVFAFLARFDGRLTTWLFLLCADHAGTPEQCQNAKNSAQCPDGFHFAFLCLLFLSPDSFDRRPICYLASQTFPDHSGWQPDAQNKV
jgi:hypothetical protein